MEWDRFEIKIGLGNDAMKTRDDVTTALIDVIQRIRRGAQIEGKIFDINGNSVGEFAFKTKHEDNNE